MKLIYCPDCATIINIDGQYTQCRCGSSYGYYLDDGINAVYGGQAIPLGFTNKSFLKAVVEQPESGAGNLFVSFVIPKECETFVKKEDEMD